MLAELSEIVGAANVLADEPSRRLYSQDVYRAGELAAAVVRPASAAEVARVAALASARRVPLFIRGGGMSYTDAYPPTTREAILLDLSRLDRVLEVRTDDLRATVEAGCTWARLDEHLAPLGLRATFWGPMSGRLATVGGAMSHGAVTYGTLRHGPSGTAALGMDVVLADGSLLQTGTATADRPSFFRHYGPDLTGLFTCDGGALGIKTAVTLRLERRPAHGGRLSFGFHDFDALLAAARTVAQEGLGTELFGVETGLARLAAGDITPGQALRTLVGVARAGGRLQGLRDAARVALAGKGFLKDSRWTLNVHAEGRDERRLELAMADVRAAVAPHGFEIANTMATVTRADPFPQPAVLGPGGRRLLPLHGILPFSAVNAFHEAMLALLARHGDELERHDVLVFVVYSATGPDGFLYEPVIYWKDEWPELHRATMAPELLAAMEPSAPNPAGRALVERLRIDMIELMYAHGAAHFQIGRAYPFLRGRAAPFTGLLGAIKRQVDPHGILNPGALGLEPPGDPAPR